MGGSEDNIKQLGDASSLASFQGVASELGMGLGVNESLMCVCGLNLDLRPSGPVDGSDCTIAMASFYNRYSLPFFFLFLAHFTLHPLCVEPASEWDW